MTPDGFEEDRGPARRLAASADHYPFSAEQLTGFGLIAVPLGGEIVDQRRPILQRLAAAPVALRWGVYYLVIFGC